MRQHAKMSQSAGSTALNAVCPYFTMFPLEFPLSIFRRHANAGDAVLDPFSGRGTTLYAARMLGLSAFGIDSNPVAVSISQAKLANTTPGRIVRAAHTVLERFTEPRHVPNGQFWRLAFHKDVLHTLCRLREGLIDNCESDSRKALRAIILGGLHGPLAKFEASYFSNQCPRTFAPKPAYATKYWLQHKLAPRCVNVLDIIAKRASRCYSKEGQIASGVAIRGDSQVRSTFELPKRVSWIVTSPPYYGMRTYIPDQWLRWWFLGGPETVDYSNAGQLSHSSQSVFCDGLRSVWDNCASVATPDCRLVVRFGAINDRQVNPKEIIGESFAGSRWRITTLRKAGTASEGKRQADHFVLSRRAIEEYDVWATLV